MKFYIFAPTRNLPGYVNNEYSRARRGMTGTASCGAPSFSNVATQAVRKHEDNLGREGLQSVAMIVQANRAKRRKEQVTSWRGLFQFVRGESS
jgi:hypothetical protein